MSREPIFSIIHGVNLEGRPCLKKLLDELDSKITDEELNKLEIPVDD